VESDVKQLAHITGRRVWMDQRTKSAYRNLVDCGGMKKLGVFVRRKQDYINFNTSQKWKADRLSYVAAKQMARKLCSEAQEIERQEFARNLGSKEGRKNVFRIAKQLSRNRKDIVGIECMKDRDGKVVFEGEEIKKIWKQYMEKLSDERKNVWDGVAECEKTEGPKK